MKNNKLDKNSTDTPNRLSVQTLMNLTPC